MDELAAFYDAWAEDYDASQVDWQASVQSQGRLLARALAGRGIEPPARVLDCTCGIGAQAIGLALAGYTVTGTDISSGEVERARRDATAFGVHLDVDVADILLAPAAGSPLAVAHDAVLSANALTHFLDRETLHRAVAAMAAATRVGGCVLIVNRDYDGIAERAPLATVAQLSTRDGVRRADFQLWDWDDDGETYRMEDVLLTAPMLASPTDERPGAWRVHSRVTRLRAWLRADIEAAATASGLVDAQWSEDGPQPILTARRG